METLKNIINILKILGVSIAGITFIILMIKIAIEPEMKSKYLKLTKHLLMATILISISLSLLELPKYYYGDSIQIVDNQKSETTIGELKDEDCQGRETVNIDGNWYVVTDANVTLCAVSEDKKLVQSYTTVSGLEISIGEYKVENCCVLRPFSKCQGTFKGYFADISYYRDSDGFIFPSDYTYTAYINAKNNSQNFERRRNS